MNAIFKRELKSYFTSPIGYVFIAVFYVFAGIFFYATSLKTGRAVLSPTFDMLFTVTIFLMPLLTMRLFSEDKKHHIDQAYLTAPVNLWEIVLGKYFSAVFVYFIAISITLVFGVVLTVFIPINWAEVIGNFFGILMLGAALIAIGMFISNLTESQIIAAVGGFAVSLVVLLINSIATLVPIEWIRNAIYTLSFTDRYYAFVSGIIHLKDVVFFISIIAIFCYLTTRIFEKKRWA